MTTCSTCGREKLPDGPYGAGPEFFAQYCSCSSPEKCVEDKEDRCELCHGPHNTYRSDHQSPSCHPKKEAEGWRGGAYETSFDPAIPGKETARFEVFIQEGDFKHILVVLYGYQAEIVSSLLQQAHKDGWKEGAEHVRDAVLKSTAVCNLDDAGTAWVQASKVDAAAKSSAAEVK